VVVFALNRFKIRIFPNRQDGVLAKKQRLIDEDALPWRFEEPQEEPD
jgi:hypothetical protein